MKPTHNKTMYRIILVIAALAIGTLHAKPISSENDESQIMVISLNYAYAGDAIDAIIPHLSESSTISAAPRVNSVFLVASKEEREIAKEIISKLDLPTEVKKQTVIVPLKYADAIEVAALINLFIPSDNKVVGDGRTNQLILNVDQNTLPMLKGIIQSVDVSVEKQ